MKFWLWTFKAMGHGVVLLRYWEDSYTIFPTCQWNKEISVKCSMERVEVTPWAVVDEEAIGGEVFLAC